MIFASLAWTAGMVSTPEPTCEPVKIITYVSIPEPAPIYKPQPLGWPIHERMIEVKEEKTVSEAEPPKDDAPEPARRHHRKHRRRWR